MNEAHLLRFGFLKDKKNLHKTCPHHTLPVPSGKEVEGHNSTSSSCIQCSNCQHRSASEKPWEPKKLSEILKCLYSTFLTVSQQAFKHLQVMKALFDKSTHFPSWRSNLLVPLLFLPFSFSTLLVLFGHRRRWEDLRRKFRKSQKDKEWRQRRGR